MASGTDKTAKFTLSVEDDVSASAKSATSSLEKFRSSIETSQDKLKNMSASLRGLKGTSDDVKTAKDQLRASIEAEKNSISTANLALLKQGTTYGELATATKKLASEREALKKKSDSDAEKLATERMQKLTGAVSAGGGPIASLSSKWTAASEIFEGAGGVVAATTFAVVGLVAAVAALAVGTVAATYSLAKFILTSRDGARSAGLMREAALDNAESAQHLGNQVDLLSSKLATPKTKLNDLATELAKTRLRGDDIVNTFNLVGQASEAMGDTVGNKLKEIATRGQLFKRFQISPLELVGTGLSFDDIAAPLAKSMKVGMADARQALFQGQVKIDVGLKAFRDAVDKRFGEVNAKKLLAIDVQLEKLHENLAGLTKGVNIEPVLTSASKFFALFDSSKSVTGDALKQMVTIIGNDLVGAFTKGQPVANSFVKGLVIGALEVGIAFFKTKSAIKSAFQDNPALAKLNLMGDASTLAKVAIYGLGAALVAAGTSAAALAVSLDAVLSTLGKLSDAATGVKVDVKNGDAKGVGLNLANGLSAGIELGQGPVQLAMSKLGDIGLSALIKKWEIHSPSKAGERLGERMPEGVAGGVDKGAPDVGRAMNDMLALPPAGGASRGGASAASITIENINITIEGGGKDTEAIVRSPSFLISLTKAFRDALAGAQVSPV